MSVNEEKKNVSPPQRPKRSSLKMANLMDPNEILSYQKKKRNSVSFQLGGNFKYKELRAKFEDIKQEATNPIKKKNFLDARKKSIKNEFALAKEMLKNKIIEEEESESEEVKENTDKNIKVGKEYEDSESDTQSKNSENENNDDKKMKMKKKKLIKMKKKKKKKIKKKMMKKMEKKMKMKKVLKMMKLKLLKQIDKKNKNWKIKENVIKCVNSVEFF